MRSVAGVDSLFSSCLNLRQARKAVGAIWHTRGSNDACASAHGFTDCENVFAEQRVDQRRLDTDLGRA